MKRLAIALLAGLILSSVAAAQSCYFVQGSYAESDGLSGSAVVPGTISSIWGAAAPVQAGGLGTPLYNSQYVFASQLMTHDFGINATMTTLNADGNTGTVAIGAQLSSNEFVLIETYTSGGHNYLELVKMEPSGNGTMTTTVIAGPTQFALPATLTMTRIGSWFYAYNGATLIGDTTLTSDVDPTLVGIMAWGQNNLLNAAVPGGEATFSSVIMSKAPDWTQIPTQLSLSSYGNAVGSVTPGVQAGNLYIGPITATATAQTTTTCATNQMGLSVAYHIGSIGNSRLSLLTPCSQPSGGQYIVCQPVSNWISSGSADNNLYVPLSHGTTYTLTITGQITTYGLTDLQPSFTRTIQLNP